MSKALKNNNNLILVSTILIILIASFSSNIKDLTGRATQEIVDDTQDGYDINGNLFNPYERFSAAIDGLWYEDDHLSYARFRNLPSPPDNPPIFFMYNKPPGVITKAEWKVQYKIEDTEGNLFGGRIAMGCFTDNINTQPMHSPEIQTKPANTLETKIEEIPQACLALNPIKLSLFLVEDLPLYTSDFSDPLLYEEAVIWTIGEACTPKCPDDAYVFCGTIETIDTCGEPTCNVEGTLCLTGTCIDGSCITTPPPACALTDADWSTTQATEGDLVTLTVTGTDCVGETLTFEVFEDDSLGDNLAAIQPNPTTFSGVLATTTWTTETDELFGDSEYYFTATLSGGASINSGTDEVDLLTVTPSTPGLEDCTNTVDDDGDGLVDCDDPDCAQDIACQTGVDCILEDLCSVDGNCPSGYVCDIESADEGFCVLNCESYNVPTSCPTDCCEWFVVGQECILKDIGELSFCGNDIKHTLEFCDGDDFGYNINTGEEITNCITYNPDLYVDGELKCYPALSERPCEFDTRLCDTGTACGDTITKCSDYSPDSTACKYEDECAFKCFINDIDLDNFICDSCTSVGICEEYPTSSTCTNNACQVSFGTVDDCVWDSDLEECYPTNNVVDEDTDETCTCPPGMGWTEVQEDGYRYSEGECDCAGISKEMKIPGRITKKFPFFSSNGIIIVLALLIGYYVFVNSNKKKK